MLSSKMQNLKLKTLIIQNFKSKIQICPKLAAVNRNSVKKLKVSAAPAFLIHKAAAKSATKLMTHFVITAFNILAI